MREIHKIALQGLTVAAGLVGVMYISQGDKGLFESDMVSRVEDVENSPWVSKKDLFGGEDRKSTPPAEQ